MGKLLYTLKNTLSGKQKDHPTKVNLIINFTECVCVPQVK